MMNNYPIQNIPYQAPNTGRLDNIPVGTYLPVAPEVPQGNIPSGQTPVNNQTSMFDVVMNLQNSGQPGLNRGENTGSYIGDVIRNIPGDIVEMAQGGITMLRHPMQTVVNPIADWALNTVPNQSVGNTIGDVANTLIGHPAGVDFKKIAEYGKLLTQGRKEEADALVNQLGSDFINHFRQDPLITASVLAPKAVSGAVGKTTRTIGQAVENATGGKVAWGQAGRIAGRVQDLVVQEVAPQMKKVREAAKDMVSEAKKAGGDITGNLAEVIHNRRQGIEIPKRLKKLDEAYDKYLAEDIKTMPTVGLESAQSLSMNQYRADKRKISYDQAEKDFIPLEEILYDGVEDIAPSIFEGKLTGLQREKAFKNKKDTKINDLSEAEVDTLLKHLEPEELDALSQMDMTIRDAENYLSEQLGERRYKRGSKLTEAQEIRYKENLNKIAEMAGAGDEIAADFLEAHNLYNRGKGPLKPVLFRGVQDIDKSVLDATDIGIRRYAGKGSSREYGSATSEQLAKAYTEALDKTIQQIAEAKMDRTVSDRVLQGTFSDGTPLVTEATKKVKYIDSNLLQDGRLTSALRSARDEMFDGAIPIDATTHGSLLNQFGRLGGNIFAGGLNDAYGLMKDAILSSGTYLGGNALSGMANMVLNSNIGLFDDMINAVRSKGQLAEKLGVARQLGVDTRHFRYKPSQAIHNVNRIVGGKLITDADAAMQNFFAEVAAHAKLRRQGIKFNDRSNSIADMAKANLADTINDVKQVALINPSRSLVPRSLQSLAGINPFWRWQDTAFQSTYHTLMQHPILSQLVAANFFGTIGFDKEMQIRQNMNIKSDKKLVTYVPDSKTGGAKEVTMDFLPVMTAVKATIDPASLARTVPLLGDMVNAAQGKNAYGKPFQRTHESRLDATVVQGDKRYQRDPKTGQIKEIGGRVDEVISTLLRDISGIPNLVNKTAGPAFAGLVNLATGRDDIRFYQPLGQSIFGSLSTGQPDTARAIFQSGDPTRGMTGADLMRRVLNLYETPYYPENQARMNKSFIKGLNRRIINEQEHLQGRR